MRRICVIATACTGLALALPGVASAHHRGRHHHHAHHSRTVTFAAHKTTTTSGTAAPSTETPTSGETAGTITSFENGVLKITLADGEVVTGKVTEATRIYCPTATTGEESSDDNDPGDQGQQGRQGWEGGDGGNHDQGYMGGRGDDESGGWSGDGGGCSSGNCGPSSLVAGAKVGVAELVITGAGAWWEKVALTQ